MCACPIKQSPEWFNRSSVHDFFLIVFVNGGNTPDPGHKAGQPAVKWLKLDVD